jgi:hypothetical protein
MKHATKFLRLLQVSVLVVGLSLLMIPSMVHAFNFTVSPLIEEFDENEAYPGQVLRGTITVRNNDTRATFYEPEIADFYYDENGNMVFFENNTPPNPDSSLREWITVNSDVFKLGPNESREVDYEISVPEDAKAGGHYGVVFFRSQPDPEGLQGSGVATSGRLGTLVLVTIPGDISKSATLQSFQVGSYIDGVFTEQDQFEAAPVSFAFTLLNTGNTYFEPQGNINVKGFNLDTNVQLASLKSFPNIPKQFIQTLKDEKFMFGKYTATLKLVDGDGNSLAPMTVNFTVYSWNFIIFWGVLILVVLVILIIAVKKASGMSKKKK